MKQQKQIQSIAPHRVILGVMSIAALATGAQTLSAQEVVADATDFLPEIVVEGTTIAVSKDIKTKKKKATSNYGQATGTPSQASSSSSGGSGDVAGANNANQIDTYDSTEEVSGTAAQDVPSGQLLKNQGNSVTVVTSQQLKAQQVRHAADALRSLPGVYVSRSGGPQSITSVRIRGAESNHTLVLIDGVEVNAADGAFDFSNLTTEDIEKIEVLRGPQSALYSSGALGGVINITTKSGKGPLTIRVRGEAGSHTTHGGAVQISAGNDNIHGIVTLSGRKTDGYNLSLQGSEDDGARFSNFAFSGGVKILPNVKLDATFRSSKTDAERDDFDGTRANGLNDLVDTASRFNSELRIGRVAATVDTLDGLWRHKIEFSGMESELFDDGRGGFVSTANFVSERQLYSYTSTLQLDTPGIAGVRHYVTARLDHQRETYEQQNASAFGASSASGDRQRTGVAGEIRGEYNNILFLNAALRHDDNDSFDDFTTWNVSGSLKVPQTPLRLHGSVGKGVKYPSLLELFGNFPGAGFVSNPDLVPEESLGWDAGIELATPDRKALIDVTYFSQNLKNEIDFSFFPLFTSFNRTGESKREGVEIAGHVDLTNAVRIGASYTYLKAREDDGSQEVRRPRHSGRADLNYSFAEGLGNLNVATAYNGEMLDLAFNNFTFAAVPVQLDEYWLVTAAASYKVSPGIEIYGRVENLLDEKYSEVFSIDGAPIAAYAGVRLTYVEEQTRAWSEGR